MDSGMNIRPVTMDFLFQAGWDWIGLYAKYSPIDLFENGKGPKGASGFYRLAVAFVGR